MATLDQVRNSTTSLTGLGLQALFTTLVSSTCIIAFAHFRHSTTFKHMYNGRSRINQQVHCQSKSCKQSAHSTHHQVTDPYLTPPARIIDLLRAVWDADETYIEHEIGLDAAVFLRFTRMCVQICSLLAVSVSLVLIPLHVSFTSDREIDTQATHPPLDGKIPLSMIRALETYSIMNLPVGTPVFYFHVLFVYLVSGVVLLLLYRSYIWFVDAFHAALLRQAKSNMVHLRTVLVKGVPLALRTEKQLLGYFTSLNLGQVESVVLSRRYSRMERRIDKFVHYLRMLELAHLDLAQAYYKAVVEVPIWPMRILISVKTKCTETFAVIWQGVRTCTSCFKQHLPWLSEQSPALPLAESTGVQSPNIGNSPMNYFSPNASTNQSLVRRRKSRIPKTRLFGRYTVGTSSKWHVSTLSPIHSRSSTLHDIQQQQVDEESYSSDSDTDLILPVHANSTQPRPMSLVSNLSMNLYNVSTEASMNRHYGPVPTATLPHRLSTYPSTSNTINSCPPRIDDASDTSSSGIDSLAPSDHSELSHSGHKQSPNLDRREFENEDMCRVPVYCGHASDDSFASYLSLPTNRRNMFWERLTSPNNRVRLTPFQPERVSPSGLVVNTIDYAHKKLLHHRQKVVGERMHKLERDKYKPNPMAYVTFKSAISAAICAQTLVSMSPSTRIVPAPEPRDILWSEYAWSDSGRRHMIKTASQVACVLLVFMWIVPISLVVALANIEQIVQVFPILKPVVDQNAVVRGFVTSIVPSLLATFFNVLFPYLLMALVSIQGVHTKSAVDAQLTKLYYAFLFFNQLVVFVIGQSVVITTLNLFFFVPIEIPQFGQTEPAGRAQSISNIVLLISQSLPRGGSFFLGYTLFQAVLHALELLQLNWGLLINWYLTRRIISRTPRDLYAATRPWSFAYFYYWPGVVLMINIAIIYSVIHPLIMIVALAYFAFGYMVYKHQLLYCYVPAYETNGSMFHDAADWIFVGLLLFQITIAGILATKQIYVGAGLVLPVIGATIMFRIHVHHTLVPRCQHVPIEALVHQEQAEDVLPPAVPDLSGRFSSTMPPRTYNGTGRSETVSEVEPSTPIPDRIQVVDSVVGTNSSTRLTFSDDQRDHQQPIQDASVETSLLSKQAFFSHDANEVTDSCPQTYDPPCIWSALPSAMWLPVDPLHVGRWDLDACEHVEEILETQDGGVARGVASDRSASDGGND